MRMQRSILGEFVPAHWTVPQNPISGGMGEFVPGSFTVPQNPIADAFSSGLSGCGCRGMGDTTSSSLSLNDISNAIMSPLSTISTSFGLGDSTWISPIPNVVVLAAGAYLAISLFGDTKRAVRAGKKRAAASRAGYAAYKRELAA
jgi:hypothetical protein